MRTTILALTFLLAGVSFAHASMPAEGTVCPMIYAPVCASHQVQCSKAPCYPVYETYSNSCMAGAANAPVLHEGACTASETGFIKPSKEAYVPPAGCIAWFDGCNSCAMQANGATACTMRACFAPAAGYCTRYASSTVSQPGMPTTSPPSQATSSIPGTPHNPIGFFHSFWNWVFHWFRR